MLKVFVGSTFRDLKDERKQILEKLDSSLIGIGMETFVPDGRSSQEIGIDNLRSSDIIIFLISPEYGSLINDCKVTNCKSPTCPLKNQRKPISYTHCEYYVALAEGKPYQAYVIDKDWKALEKLSKWPEINWREIRKDVDFDNISEETVEKYFRIAQNSLTLRDEIRNIYSPLFKNADEISKDLAKNIVEWYYRGEIKLQEFCGRRTELKDLVDKMDETVEVSGVGGVGKTTLIQVAMLIQKLKGKRPVSIGTRQSYVTGSGYDLFNKKCKDTQHEVIGDKISLDDISSALFIPPNSQSIDTDSRIKNMVRTIEKNQIILFIDDFHLADKDVTTLVQSAKSVVVSSKRGLGSTRCELSLKGIAKADRKELIELIANRVNKYLSNSDKETIELIAEGHPVSTEILIRNNERIDFQKIKEFKSGLDLSIPPHVDEFLKRVVKGVLCSDAFVLLKDLALINSEITTNINKSAIEQSFAIPNLQSIFNELIDAGMLEKKRNQESSYQFVFRHIQDTLKDEKNLTGHAKIVLYYDFKMRAYGKKFEDTAEYLFHTFYSNLSADSITQFLETAEKIKPAHKGFRRFIAVGLGVLKNVSLQDRAAILEKLGVLFGHINCLTDAQKNLTEALDIWQTLEEENPGTYTANLASVKTSFGELKTRFRQFGEAELMLFDSLTTWQSLPDKTAEKTLLSIAEIKNDLGELYYIKREFKKAEGFYLESLSVYESIKKYSSKHLDDIAQTKNNLADLLCDVKRFDEAEKFYKESLEIRAPLAKKNPEVYLSHLALTKNNLGTLYCELRRFEEAEAVFTSAFEIWQSLIKKNSEAYFPQIAPVLNNLGFIYQKKRQTGKAEKAYKKSMEVRQSLADKNPEAFLPGLAEVQTNFAIFYLKIGRLEEAESMFKNAFDTFQILEQQDPGVYLFDVARLENGLGSVYAKLGRPKDAEKMFLAASTTVQFLVEKNSGVYLPDLASIKDNLADLYADLGHFKEAEKEIKEAIAIWQPLANEQPEAFLPDLIGAKRFLASMYQELNRSLDHEKIMSEIKDDLLMEKKRVP